MKKKKGTKKKKKKRGGGGGQRQPQALFSSWGSHLHTLLFLSPPSACRQRSVCAGGVAYSDVTTHGLPALFLTRSRAKQQLLWRQPMTRDRFSLDLAQFSSNKRNDSVSDVTAGVADWWIVWSTDSVLTEREDWARDYNPLAPPRL